MDDNILIMVDCENICRLCLRSTGAMSDIFTTYGEKSMQQQILCITGLTTKQGDGLPSKICHRCRHIVEQACELRDVVDRTSRILSKTAHESDDVADGAVIEEMYEDDIFSKTDDISQTQDEEKDFAANKNDVIATDLPAPVPRKKYSRGKRPPSEVVCQICLEQFATKEDVRRHAETHYVGSTLQIYLDINKRPFTCTYCDEPQLNKPQLVKHHRRHLNVNPYVCKHPGCSYRGKDRDGIRHHLVVHEPPSRACEQCGATFRRRSDLVSHIVRTHPAAALAVDLARVCASCGLRTRNEPALRRHKKAHHFAPRFPCPYGSCSRAYRSQRALADHERAHRGERRYRCPLCNVADYTSSSNLKRHMKMHDRSRMSKCDKCPAAFEEYTAFHRHRIAHHGPWQPHRCRACNQGYQSESQLDKHNETCEQLKQMLDYEGQTNKHSSQDMETDDQSMTVWLDDFTNFEEETFIEQDQENGIED